MLLAEGEEPVTEAHLYNQDRDILWVCVMRGKRTSAVLCTVQILTSLVSFSLCANAGVPEGSGLLLASQILLFCSCWVFLLFPHFPQLSHTFKKLLFAVSFWAFLLATLLFSGATIASTAIDQCQGAISLTFISSFAVVGSFVVLFLGSIKPPEMSLKTYVKSNFPRRIAATTGEFENVPLGVIRGGGGASPSHTAAFNPVPSASSMVSTRENEEEGHNTSVFSIDDGDETPISTSKGVDAMEII